MPRWYVFASGDSSHRPNFFTIIRERPIDSYRKADVWEYRQEHPGLKKYPMRQRAIRMNIEVQRRFVHKQRNLAFADAFTA